MSKKPWHERLPFLALIELSRFRKSLRTNNLHDTSQLPDRQKLPQPAPPQDDRHLTARMEDGSYNDPGDPQMGMAGTRFGRNVPLEKAKPDRQRLMSPDPRTISRRLMTRKEFKPATILNVLAAAWIQFENHDWFSHGENDPSKKIPIPLQPDDPWPEDHRPLEIDQTQPDPSQPEGDEQQLPTHINHCTHWWDGSQIYGSTAERVDALRTHSDGKIKIGEDGRLLEDPDLPGIDFTGFSDNWWVGLSLLHTLFTKEHNHICDELKHRNPSWNDQELFDHARLITAALTAKIHTVEWTPGILPHPALRIGMDTNWWGILGQSFKNSVREDRPGRDSERHHWQSPGTRSCSLCHH